MSEIDLSIATPEQLEQLGPVGFTRVVRSLSDGALAVVMRGPNREVILSQVFPRMPGLFRPERAGGATASTHWSVTDRPDGGSSDWTVRVTDGECTVTPGLAGDSDAALTMSGVTFFKLITKSGNPVMMYLTGKLKIRGDVGLAARLGGWFDAPDA